MNDTPGWASPGSSPSDGREPGASGPAEPADRPGGPDRPAQPADQPGTEPTGPGTKWSKEQPPPGQWSAPSGPGQAPPPPPPNAGWGTPALRRPPEVTRALVVATAAATAVTARPVATAAGVAAGAVPRPRQSPA